MVRTHERRRNGWVRQLEQRFQVELRGRQYYVVDTVNQSTVGGPFKKRAEAQAGADRWEQAAG